MTLQQLLVLAGLTDRGTDPNAFLGNFQNPFNSMSNVPTSPSFVPMPTHTPIPTPTPEPLPPVTPTSPLRERMVDEGGRETNAIEDFAPGFTDIPLETRAWIDPTMPDPNSPSMFDTPAFTASYPDTPGFWANTLGQLANWGLSAVPHAGPFLGLAGRLIGLPSMIAQAVTPNITVNPGFLLGDPLARFTRDPTLSLDISPMDIDPAAMEALSSAPDEPGNEGGDEDGDGDGDGGDD